MAVFAMAKGRWVKREEEAAQYLDGFRITKKFRGNSCGLA
jgi:hypothetical protein